MTVQTSIGPVDLLCYGFPEAWPGPLRQLMDRYRRWQCDYGAAVCRGMQAQGFGYSQQDRRSLLETYRPAQVLAVQGTTHVRNEVQRNHFLRRGYIASPQEYPLLLMRLEQEHALPEYPPVQEVVPVVHAAGGWRSLPIRSGTSTAPILRGWMRLRDECRFDGIECAHLLVPLELTPVYRRYCLAHGLVSTAGSDCHTHADIDLTFGRHGGARNWLDELLERLPS